MKGLTKHGDKCMQKASACAPMHRVARWDVSWWQNMMVELGMSIGNSPSRHHSPSLSPWVEISYNTSDVK